MFINLLEEIFSCIRNGHQPFPTIGQISLSLELIWELLHKYSFDIEIITHRCGNDNLQTHFHEQRHIFQYSMSSCVITKTLQTKTVGVCSIHHVVGPLETLCICSTSSADVHNIFSERISVQCAELCALGCRFLEVLVVISDKSLGYSDFSIFPFHSNL